MDFYMPTRLHTGERCVERAASELGGLGSSCVIVTGRHAAQASGALADVQAALASCGVSSFVWDGVTENPPVASCAEAGRVAAEKNAQFVVGIGGGSALDAAKAVAVFLANPELDETGFYAKAWTQAPAPIALVGTTAGTGSEVTKVSVLTDAAARKHSIHDDRLFAAVAFGDSRYTQSCSLPTTLSCGVDVLAHATESYFSRKADEISRAFSVRAIRGLAGPLSAAAQGRDLSQEQRRQLYEASILGGLAINTTGTCFPHNVGYYLTETYRVPHGFASAVFLPDLLSCVGAADVSYARGFYDALGMDEAAIVSLVEMCLPTLDVCMSAEEVAAVLPRWQDNGSVKNTRADVGTDDIRRMLEQKFVRP